MRNFGTAAAGAADVIDGGDDSDVANIVGNENDGDKDYNENQVNRLHQVIEDIGDAESDVTQRFNKVILEASTGSGNGVGGRRRGSQCKLCFPPSPTAEEVNIAKRFINQEFPGFVSLLCM